MPYTGKIRVLDDYPEGEGADKVPAVDQVPPQNDLQTAWNEDGRFYQEREGKIEVAGKQYQFKVSFLDLRFRDFRDESFPTQRRVITEVAPDLNKSHDIVIPVLPGWGETSAQFEGDFIEILLEVLKEAGYENPKVIGINVSGRGTPEYMMPDNKNRISGVGMMDEVFDAQNIADALSGRGYFGKKGDKPSVAVIGHSMGALNSTGFLDVLNNDGGIPGQGRMRNKDLRVEKLLHMMPAVDGPFAMMRAKFLWAVRNQVMEATRQAIAGRGSLELGEEDYHRIMFGDAKHRDMEQFLRSVPDSSRRFLELTLNLRRRFANVYREGGTAEGVKMTVWEGGRDKLIPVNAIDDLSFQAAAGGLEQGVNIRTLPMLSHSIPFRLRDEQMIDVREALKSWIA